MLALARLGVRLPSLLVCFGLAAMVQPAASASDDLNQLLQSALAETQGEDTGSDEATDDQPAEEGDKAEEDKDTKEKEAKTPAAAAAKPAETAAAAADKPKSKYPPAAEVLKEARKIDGLV